MTTSDAIAAWLEVFMPLIQFLGWSCFVFLMLVWARRFPWMATASWFAHRPPVYLDGLLWVVIAMGQAALGRLGSEDAFKYVDPYVLYWVKTFVEVLTQGATGLKMFRSTSYSKHVDSELEKEKTP